MNPHDADALLIENFIDVLEREHLALLKGDADLLGALAEEKLRIESKIHAEHDLETTLKEEGQAHRLYARIQRARELNAINGIMIKDQLQRLKGTLYRLQSLGPKGAPPHLYGRDGQENRPHSRPLGVA